MVSLSDFCLRQGFEKTYWIAYSGGLDSQALLHLFVKLREEFPLKLKAIHIHHGLSPNADAWMKHCENVCSTLQIDFVSQKIIAKAASGESQEDVARQRRYAVFAELLAKDDLLLTAHHQNDQAETLLLQLLRGSGPKGLAAMPHIKKLGAGWHVRPLLDVSREELKSFAAVANLHWIEDESNNNINFSRNFLRHKIIPILQERWPTVTKTLARVAANCADVDQVLEEMIQNELSAAKGSQPNTLSVSYLKQITPARQRLLLREWIHQRHLSIPSSKKIQQILIDMLEAREDKSPHLQWGKVEMRRYRNNLYLLSSEQNAVVQQELSWNSSKPLLIPGIGVLSKVLPKGQELDASIKQVVVRFRQGGEHIALPGRAIHHSLKKLFQEWEVPPWERDRVPLIYVNNELAAVVGFVVCDGYHLLLSPV